ncbi:MAG: heat-inducible transcriptional repressor HrcA [Bacilli bacterium]|nr:heat-inducible transcriptional repressor HrcA [Bacilli bacterium]
MKYNRSDTILKLIVEYFIKNAQPVGSHTLIDEYHLPYSSATIRNEMYALEKMGLIEKTHSSSGRVPSSKGYRYYCEHLRDKNVDENLKNSLQMVLEQKVQSIEEVIKASCEILSHMTSLVSVVMGSDDGERLANIQLIPISENTITAVFVTDKGYVENKTFIVPNEIKTEELVDCVKLLNDRLKGTYINELVTKIEALKPVLSDYVVSHDIVYQALLETFIRFAGDRLSLYGRDEIFKQPEFKNDTEKLEKMLKLLNDQSVFKEVDDELNAIDEKNVILKIGEVKDNPDVSMVTAKLKIGDSESSTITLLGPTRMDYDRALSALEYIAEELNKYFKDLNGGNNGGDA